MTGDPQRVAVVSGYFNPLHIGHLRMIRAAREHGDHLLVIVNNDRQQLLKKGRILMTEDDRHAIVAELRTVDEEKADSSTRINDELSRADSPTA